MVKKPHEIRKSFKLLRIATWFWSMWVVGFVCGVVDEEYFIRACVKSKFPCDCIFTGNILSLFTLPSTGFQGFPFDSNMANSVCSCLPAVLSTAHLLLWSIVFQDSTLFKKSFSFLKYFSLLSCNTRSTIKAIVHCLELWVSVINLGPDSARCSAWAQAFCLHTALCDLGHKESNTFCVILSLISCGDLIEASQPRFYF